MLFAPQWKAIHYSVNVAITKRFVGCNYVLTYIEHMRVLGKHSEELRDQSLFMVGVAPKRNVFLIKILLIQPLKGPK